MGQRPRIDSTRFGAITIDGKEYGHDVLIRPDGQVEKRAKVLSRAIYGTSHIISLEEARQVYQHGASRLILGTGQGGLARLSEEAAAYFRSHGCVVEASPTPEAALVWNNMASGESAVGLFHVTC